MPIRRVTLINDTPPVTVVPSQSVMRHFDVTVLWGDDGVYVSLVHAKSPAAAIRTALYSIEDHKTEVDPQLVKSMSVGE